MYNANQILERLDVVVSNNLSVNYSSDGKVLTKAELKPKVKMIKNLILNVCIDILEEKGVGYLEVKEAQDILLFQK